MPSTNVSVEKSMEEILGKVQREYAEQAKQDARATTSVPRLAEPHDTNQGGEKASSPDITEPSTAADGVTAAVSQLAAIYSHRRRANEFPIGNSNTLEEVVRELLRPVLQGWLDDKLTGIVERMVKAELSRIIRDAV